MPTYNLQQNNEIEKDISQTSAKLHTDLTSLFPFLLPSIMGTKTPTFFVNSNYKVTKSTTHILAGELSLYLYISVHLSVYPLYASINGLSCV